CLLRDVHRGGYVACGGGDRGCQRVGRVLLDRHGERQYLILGDTVAGDDSGDGGFVAGEGAGFVDGEVSDGAEELECRTAFDDDSELSGRVEDRKRVV